MKKEFLDAVKDRRTYYGIGKEIQVADENIYGIVKEAVKYTPSSFNSQSARAIVLLKEQHDRLWDITVEALRKIVPADAFQSTEEKINSFKNGYGTIVFFEDQDVIKSLQEAFGLYKDNFPVWSQQSSGMLQMVVWTELEANGLGASLQHYNELIEAELKKEFDLPENWKIIAQMPFGQPVVMPDEKQFNFQEEHVRLFK
jgi:predicted oxidoreductase (fatty acid repression mutant protein)